MKTLDFIQRVLIDEIKVIQRNEGDLFITFHLIGFGIEFLGACLDSEPFSAKGLSAPRFRRAIYDLFPATYQKVNQGSGKLFDLYESLRCCLFLVILPGSRLKLIRRFEEENTDAHHLDIKEIEGLSRLVLVLEDLFEDYERACKEVIERMKDGRLNGWKFKEDV